MGALRERFPSILTVIRQVRNNRQRFYIKNMTVAPGFDRNLSGEYATITVRQAIPQQI